MPDCSKMTKSGFCAALVELLNVANDDEAIEILPNGEMAMSEAMNNKARELWAKENFDDAYPMPRLTGIDVDLQISLEIHGFAWFDDGEDYWFVYGVYFRGDCSGEYAKFEISSYSKEISVEKEWDWVEWESIFKYLGTTEGDFREYPVYEKIHVLYDYYGPMEIFGESYAKPLGMDGVFEWYKKTETG